MLSAINLQVFSKPTQSLIICEDLCEPNILARGTKGGIFGLKCCVK